MNDRKKCFLSLKANHRKSNNCSCENTFCENCLSSCDSRSAPTVIQNGKKYKLNNTDKRTIAIFNVDGGMINDESKRKCDNLMLDLDGYNAIFIELKGTDLAHAFIQIISTLDMLKNDINEYAIHARIVSSNRTNVPNMKTHPNYIKLCRMIKSPKNIKVQANCIEDNILSI